MSTATEADFETIVRATQFHEFMETLAEAYSADGAVNVPDI